MDPCTSPGAKVPATPCEHLWSLHTRHYLQAGGDHRQSGDAPNEGRLAALHTEIRGAQLMASRAHLRFLRANADTTAITEELLKITALLAALSTAFTYWRRESHPGWSPPQGTCRAAQRATSLFALVESQFAPEGSALSPAEIIGPSAEEWELLRPGNSLEDHLPFYEGLAVLYTSRAVVLAQAGVAIERIVLALEARPG